MKPISMSIPYPISNENPRNWGSKKAQFQENAGESPDMDETIWCRFPEDLLIRVFSHLPIPSIFQTTLVCKSWNSILSSSYFLRLNYEIRRNSQSPWFLIFLNKGFADLCLAYDPSLNRWIDLSFRFLPSSLYRPVAAGDGLICMLYKNPSGIHLYISNPISNSQKKIPTPWSLHRYFFIVSGLFADEITGSFRLVLVGTEPISNGSDLFVLSAEVYNSEMGSWARTRSFPVSSPVSRWRAISNGVLYCILCNSLPSIVALDTKLMAWFVLEAPLPSSLTVIRLMDRNGRLVVIGGVGTNGITKEIGIWELSNSGREWGVIGWLPEEFCDVFLTSHNRLFGCVGHGDLVYFTSKRCPYVAMYNISTRSMRFLEPSPRLLDPHHHVSTGFCFQPRL